MAKSYFDLLKEGIEQSDWNVICKAYENITGNPISPPKAPRFVPERFDDEDGGIARTNVDLSRGQIGDMGKPMKRTPVKVKKSINLFVDDGELANLKQSEKEKNSFVKPQGRERAETVTVFCKKCKERAFMERSALKTSVVDETGERAESEYICGNCLAKKGR